MSSPRKSPKRTVTLDKAEHIGSMQATLDYLKDDFGMMREELKVMNQTLAVNTEQLKVHIEGVQLAREQNKLLRQDVDQRLDQMVSELKPIEAHVTKVQLWGKIAAWVAGSIIAPLAIWGAAKIIETIIGL